MPKDPILYSLVLFGGVIAFLWKYFAAKNLRHLMTAFLLVALILPLWPLFLPNRICFAIWGFAAAGFMIYENPYKKGTKNTPSITYLYILIFIAFGLVFLTEALIDLRGCL